MPLTAQLYKYQDPRVLLQELFDIFFVLYSQHNGLF
jgi:hypothetical protein